MKRVIGIAAAFGTAACMAQAMPTQETGQMAEDRFSGFATGVLTGLVPVGDSVLAEESYRLARGRGGGGRGGGGARKPGGYSQGAQRQQQRSVDRDVDVDIDIDDDHIIEDDAVRGAVVGIGVGAAIANNNDPNYTCPDENADGVCDDNPAN